MSEAHAQNLHDSHTAGMALAWYNAAFARAAKLPPLKEVIGTKKTQSKKLDEGAMMAYFRSYQHRREELRNDDRSRD